MERVEISLGNWNNQAEYDAYKALSPMDRAAGDFELPATKVLVGYRKIVIYTPWGKEVLPRWNGSAAYSLAIDGKAICMEGEDFIPLEFDIQGVPRNDLKYTVFFRTKAEEDCYNDMQKDENADPGELKAQENRYQSAYQIIEEADLISEYEYWKSKVAEN